MEQLAFCVSPCRQQCQGRIVTSVTLTRITCEHLAWKSFTHPSRDYAWPRVRRSRQHVLHTCWSTGTHQRESPLPTTIHCSWHCLSPGPSARGGHVPGKRKALQSVLPQQPKGNGLLQLNPTQQPERSSNETEMLLQLRKTC